MTPGNPFAPSLPPDPLVLIIGGGGLGREIATQFLDRGARVHICDIDSTRLQEIVARNDPGRLKSSCIDIGDAHAASRLFEDVAAWGREVSVLVNNVGIAGVRAPVEELTDADWLESLQANFLDSARCVRHVVGAMKRARAGLIVNISTVSVRTLVSIRDVAAMVIYLASDTTKHVTGQLIEVDGRVEWEA